MFDAVFIDADNTLFDFDRTQAKAINHSLSHFSLPADSAVLAEYDRINKQVWALYNQGDIRNDDINLLRWQQWLQWLGKTETVNAGELAEHYADSLAQQCELEEGADALMTYLLDKLPVHIITNGFPSTQQHRWRKAGWETKLQGITVSSVVGVQKPDAEIFHLAMKAVGVSDASRCLMIGDTLVADVQGPQQMGMKACWYQRKGAQNNTDIKPDFTVQHLEQIAAIF